MKTKLLFLSALAAGLLCASAEAQQATAPTFDVSLYGVLANMSGNVAVKGVPADVDAGFDKILDHLKFGGGGTVRLGYGSFALSTDLIYMDLEATKGACAAEAQQWMVQPQLEYQICKRFVVYAGARCNNIHLGLEGPLDLNEDYDTGSGSSYFK